MRLEGLDKLKNPIISSGIEPTIFHLIPINYRRENIKAAICSKC
jgi:hypothetical protein